MSRQLFPTFFGRTMAAVVVVSALTLAGCGSEAEERRKTATVQSVLTGDTLRSLSTVKC